MMDRRMKESQEWTARLKAAAAGLAHPAAFMEVCGTHTVSAFRSGVHSLMPENVRLLSGPGCPVCVTSQGDIDLLIELGSRGDVTLCTYGDMLRVTGAKGNLELARSRGADVRVVMSTLDAVRIAAAEPGRQVVFAAVGFETTAPATGAAVLEAKRRGLKNFSVLASHKLVIPAMRALLESRKVNIHGFLCPGHVSVVIGVEAYRPIVETYGLPCVIAGFEDVQILAGLARLTELARDGAAALENQYPQAVSAGGNAVAQRLLAQVFAPADVTWRALGVLPASGLVLRPEYAEYDAALRYGLTATEGKEPKGCRCGDVITGRATPAECRLFGGACTPIDPVGPCMVSSEGVCQAWFKYQRRQAATAKVRAGDAERAEVAP